MVAPHLCPQMFYVYILKSEADGKLYIGRTADIQKRINEHKNGMSASTKHRLPIQLVYYEAYKSEKDASLREDRLKYYGKALGQLKGRIEHSLCAGKGAGW